MSARPITLLPHELRAALDGRLELILRPVVPQPGADSSLHKLQGLDRTFVWFECEHGDTWPDGYVRCPLGQPGDELWARESIVDPVDIGDGLVATLVSVGPTHPKVTLRNTGVRVVRVHGLSEREASDSGCPARVNPFGGEPAPAIIGRAGHEVHGGRGVFAERWDSHYASRGLGWDANPWAWAVGVEDVP